MYSVDFFKENDHVNIHDFKSEIFEEDDKKKTMFDDYKKHYEELKQCLRS